MGLSVSKLHHQLLRHKHPGAKSSSPCAKAYIVVWARQAYIDRSVQRASTNPHHPANCIIAQGKRRNCYTHTYIVLDQIDDIYTEEEEDFDNETCCCCRSFIYWRPASAHLVLISCCKESSSRRRKVPKSCPTTVSLLSDVLYALWMHYKALRRKRDLLVHTLKVETGGGRETEMRRAHGHRTSTFIICYWTTLNCLADSHRFKMRIYSL